MGPGGSESLDEDTPGHAGTAKQTVICSEILQEISRRSWREAHTHAKRAETTTEHAAAERHQGHCFMTK